MITRTQLMPLDPGPLPKRPLVSVLMSNYNYAQYIGSAVESVLRQTYPHLELIVCDDGSTDESIKALAPYLRDSRVRLIAKQNGGHASGLNAAYESSQGDVLCLLDADDLLLPDKLERVIERMRESEDAGCVINASVRVNDALKPQGKTPLFAALPQGWRGPEVLRAGGLLSYMPSTPGLNFRRKLADLLFPLPATPPLHFFPDMVLSRLTPLYSSIAAIDEPLAMVRLHDANTYQRRRVTRETVRHELMISERLWELQFRHLYFIDPKISATLAPLNSARCILLQQYIAARLERKDYSIEAKRLLRHIEAEGRPVLERMFWKASSIIPARSFEALINFALNQNGAKQILGNLKNRLQPRRAAGQSLEYSA